MNASNNLAAPEKGEPKVSHRAARESKGSRVWYRPLNRRRRAPVRNVMPPESATFRWCRPHHRVQPTPDRSAMSDDVVVLRRYHDEMSAQLDAMVLEANGIPARVMADTGGGMIPSMAIVFPVRLLVRAGDATLAAELLDTPAADDADD
jgi:hypothetical protein